MAALEDHASLRGRRLICNPVFAQSVALGGADADLITDTGLLIDFKSTSTTRTCSAIDIWQLCGYALADTNDDYQLRSVGLSALRWRTPCCWKLDELVTTLAGEPVSVERLRQDFAAVLRDLTRSRLHRATSNSHVTASVPFGGVRGPELGENGRMHWRCAFCGEMGAAREGEPTTMRSGATTVRILLPSYWRKREGKPACPACSKVS